MGHFFIGVLSAKRRAEKVKECIKLCIAHDINVVNLTCDGPSVNISMLQSLGACLDPQNLKTFFTVDNQKINVKMDAVHMLKLVRNTLGEYKVLRYGESLIKWEYIVKLNELQKAETGTKN